MKSNTVFRPLGGGAARSPYTIGAQIKQYVSRWCLAVDIHSTAAVAAASASTANIAEFAHSARTVPDPARRKLATAPFHATAAATATVALEGVEQASARLPAGTNADRARHHRACTDEADRKG